MGLDGYRQKRDFDLTPEPRPAAGRRKLGAGEAPPRAEEDPRFVIHRHDASRHHYDLRLEHAGVLRSWAVPRGLATPHDRRKLAVAVEDHPLEYLGFSGRIPAGQYGAGLVEIWDSGSYKPLEDPGKGLAAGKLTFRLRGGRVRGEFTLSRMRENDWLLILGKERELNPDLRAAGEAAAMPRAVSPMLATLAPAAFDSPDYMFEIKFDGIRALSYLDREGRLSIKSRNLREQAVRYPELAGLGARFLARELIADGEIVAMDERGASRFQLLQPRINLEREEEIAAAAAAAPAYYYIFDLLYLDGRDLTGLSFINRRQILERIFMPDRRLRLSEAVPERGEALFSFARDHGLEGVVAKLRYGPYRQKRSHDWLKFKAVREQEFVIGGYTEPRATRSRFGALLLGIYRGDELDYTGHVGTGFSEEAIEQVYEAMHPLEQPASPFATPPRPNEPAHWLKPELVAEVKFAEWTREGILRQPVFLGLRYDKDPLEVTWEEVEEAGGAGAAAAAPAPGPPPASKAAPAPKFGTAPGPHPEPAAPAVLPSLELPARGDLRLDFSGREVRISNPNKVFWSREGYTKADLIDYYHRISPFILPHLHGRPLTLKRYPDGAGSQPFFQKEAPPETPVWVHTESLPVHTGGEEGASGGGSGTAGTRDRRIRYLICDEEATLIFLANLACISQNAWLSALPEPERPDLVAFDLDPLDPDDFEAAVEAALLVRDQLAGFGLRAYAKTSGATGIHVYVPVGRRYTYRQTRRFAEVIATLCRDHDPGLITLEQSLKRRSGSRLYLDFRQNVMGKTLASAYSVRARPGAPVSTPLSWDEVRTGLRPTDFTMAGLPERLQRKGDLFAPVLSDRQDLLAALSQGKEFLQAGQ